MTPGSLTVGTHGGKPLQRPLNRLDFLPMMTSNPSKPSQSFRRPARRRWACLGAAIIIAGAATAGCTSEDEIPPAEVKPVTAYGLTLDEKATPKQVAFVLLRAIVDDVQAAQAHDRQRQEQALKLTYSLAAYSTVARTIGLSSADSADSRSAAARSRNKKIYDHVKQWGAIAAHYIRSFDTEFQAAERRMQLRGETANVARVVYDVSHDPAETDPARRQTATLEIELVKEPADGLKYWRVARVSFVPPGTGKKTASRSAPASAPQE